MDEQMQTVDHDQATTPPIVHIYSPLNVPPKAGAVALCGKVQSKDRTWADARYDMTHACVVCLDLWGTPHG